MKPFNGRLVRFLTATSVLTALTVGASPALAADAIPYYQGSAVGQAVNLTVDPSSALNVRLDALQQLINSLPLGAGASVNNLIGSTLKNPTAPINVVIDGASAQGTAAEGKALTDGKAVSTAIKVDAASLETELALLDKALKNMPKGTVDALAAALKPLLDANPTLKQVFEAALPDLSQTLTNGLGSPSINLLKSISANFGEDKTDSGVLVQNGGILTQNGRLSLKAFEARAMPSDAFANNTVNSLDLGATGSIGLVNNGQLKQALQTLEAALVNVEQTVYKVGNTVGVGAITGTLGNTLFPVVNGTISTVDATVLNTVDLNQINKLISSVSAMLGVLNGLNGLALNDIVGTGPATALSVVNRGDSEALANGVSQVQNISVLRIKNPGLASLLKAVTGRDVTELASVGLIKGNATVRLDGVNKAKQEASSTLQDVKVLGMNLAELAGIDLDKLLPPGTSCTIAIPGKSTCQGFPLQIPDALGILGSVTNGVTGGQSLLSINLARGAGVFDPTADATHGSASITTLEISVHLNCGLVNDLVTKLLGNATVKIPVPMTLAVCGVGLDGTNSVGMAPANGQVLYARDAKLVDTALGVASATLSTKVLTPGQPPQAPPTTGNNLLILVALGAALVAGGVGIQVWRGRTARI